MIELTFHLIRETKNYALYECEQSPFSKLYLPKGLPHTVKVSIGEVIANV